MSLILAVRPLVLIKFVIIRQLSPRSVDKKTLASFSVADEEEEEELVPKEVVEIEQAELTKATDKSNRVSFKFCFFIKALISFLT